MTLGFGPIGTFQFIPIRGAPGFFPRVALAGAEDNPRDSLPESLPLARQSGLKSASLVAGLGGISSSARGRFWPFFSIETSSSNCTRSTVWFSWSSRKQKTSEIILRRTEKHSFVSFVGIYYIMIYYLPYKFYFYVYQQAQLLRQTFYSNVYFVSYSDGSIYNVLRNVFQYNVHSVPKMSTFSMMKLDFFNQASFKNSRYL